MAILELALGAFLQAGQVLPPTDIAREAPSALCGDEKKTKKPEKPEAPSALCGDEKKTKKPEKPEAPSAV